MNTIQIEANSQGQHCAPYWKRMICGDRAGMAMRADYRDCLATAVRECGFQELRQHGMFHDDMYIWHKKDAPFNFQYLFSNYDYYLSLGIRPLVELSFMPTWMASNDNRVFTVKCAACPPNNYDDWYKLIHTTVKALVARYGIEEVRHWNFEVWNEPNIAFFKGTQAEYFEVYRRAVEAVKAVDASLRVGGPATSNFVPDKSGEFRPVWVEDFMNFCAAEKLPVDFISSHPYPTDFPFDDLSKTFSRVVRDRGATVHDLKLLRQLVDNGPFPKASIYCNEWGSSPSVRDFCHDHLFDGSFLLENVLAGVGLVDSLARWIFSDISEEAPPGPSEFHGGWGLLTVHGIRKPGFHAYTFLNRVGETLLHNGDGFAAFRSPTGLQILLFNHHHYSDAEAEWETIEEAEKMIGTGSPRTFDLTLTHLPNRVRVTRRRVDQNHGWALPAWREMGAPDWPTPTQIQHLHKASEPEVIEQVEATENGTLRITETLQPLAFQLIEINPI